MPEPKIKEKTWKKELEEPIYKDWKDRELYRFDKKSKKKVFSIDTPPPYVNTPVHIGQATTYVLMDMFARYRRMKGYNVLFPLGLDRNGLPIEMATERKFGIKLTETSREEFLRKCEKVLEESSIASTESFLRLGVGFNSWKVGKEIGEVYETDSPDYRSLTQDTFIDMWHKGLIYEDERVNNYCPGCQTTIADAEVEYVDKSGFFYDVKFKCKETGEEIVIGTTRPELICSLGMIVFNPKDDRYKHLEGKTAISPIYRKEVTIIAHPSAQIEKGTGLMMMCSFGDLTDIRFFREQNLKPIIAINKDGKMNEEAGFLKGLRIKEARKKIVNELEQKNLLVQKTPTQEHRTPICERSKDPIEFIAMKEFYVKQVEFKDKMAGLANKLKFYAPKSRQIMLDWINSVTIDWPISRRRYYATEVPLWYCKKCRFVIVPPKGKYHQPWRDRAPVGKCPGCGCGEFIGEERVFDTWFDSSISPLYILKYSRDPEFFEKHSPCSLRPQGKEIIRTWLYYTVLKDYLLTGKLIFKDVWINYHILDGKGHKMSKSKGNVIDPKDVLDRFGAEPFRLWSSIEGNLEKQDFRCSFERIEGAGKTLTKLWNITRFISMFGDVEKKPGLMKIDQWIINEIDGLGNDVEVRYGKYDFHNPGIQLKHFLWETFASHYLEMVKKRAYNPDEGFSKEEQEAAVWTLNYVLDKILLLMSPIIPFITYKLYKDLRGKDIHFEKFPKKEKIEEIGFKTEDIVNANSLVWKTKKENGKSLKEKVKEVILTENLKEIEKDFKLMHNIEKLEYGKEVKVIL